MSEEVLLNAGCCVQALGSGVLSSEKADFLEDVRTKMGLSKEGAEKIIKGVQNQHLISGLQVGQPAASPPAPMATATSVAAPGSYRAILLEFRLNEKHACDRCFTKKKLGWVQLRTSCLLHN